MKKIMLCAAVLFVLNACNSNDKKSEKTETNDKVGVPNVNGNIPDTTNAIDLSTHKDSAKTVPVDSMK